MQNINNIGEYVAFGTALFVMTLSLAVYIVVVYNANGKPLSSSYNNVDSSAALPQYNQRALAIITGSLAFVVSLAALLGRSNVVG